MYLLQTGRYEIGDFIGANMELEDNMVIATEYTKKKGIK